MVFRRAPLGGVVAVIVNLGCGNRVFPGAVNVDRAPLAGVDVVHDLDVYPWPFESSSVDEILALHVFEHIEDPLDFMAECHRILKLGGQLRIEVPHWQHRNAFTDPTHRRFCTEDTFHYWVPGTWPESIAGAAYHRGCLFDEVLNEVSGPNLTVVLRKR